MLAKSVDRPIKTAAARAVQFTAAGLVPAVMVALVGCQAPAKAVTPTAAELHVVDYDAFFDRTLSTLRERDFHPEHVDRQRGVIVTRPTTGAQWFEFWRVDSRGGYQLLESSLHTVRRAVTVCIEPVDHGGVTSAPATATTEASDNLTGGEDGGMVASRSGQYRISVEVRKSRYSAPERQVTTASGALAIYSERLPTTEGLRAARDAGADWVDLGRDQPCEQYLLAKISGQKQAF